ncbi:MAG: GDSL-type esterase/lipase family protein [Tannerellaceae bacterium]
MTKRKKRFIDWLRMALTVSLTVLLVSIHFAARKEQSATVCTDEDLSAERIWPADTACCSLPFAIDSLCVATDGAQSLAPFFAALDSLRAGKDTVISIVHLGDSHIQAGHYSGRIMRLLHEQFGSAGRGWLSPHKLGRSNEPDDYMIASSAKGWIAGRCIQRVQKCPIGPGGIGLQTASPVVNLDLTITPRNGAGYSFNQAVLYRSSTSMPLLPAGVNKQQVHLFRAQSAVVPGLLTDTFRIDYRTDSLQLHSTRRKAGTDSLLPSTAFTNRYYGFSLTNGQPGILYHSVAVNGAMFVNYTDEAYVRQLALLKPSLLIISLGTNETFGRRFSAVEFSGQIRAFLTLVKREMPHTALMLTTPPECYKRIYVRKKRTYVRNENIQCAARAITELAARDGIACWDLFTATGGVNSCKKWYAAQLMARDRVHFSKEGYQEQGVLLYRALMRLKEKKMSLPNEAY